MTSTEETTGKETAAGAAARGRVTFVGAGPGAADLLTFRAARAIAAADVVIWASSLVQAEVLEHARPDAELLDSAAMALEDVLVVYERAAREGLAVARVHSGDPALWGGTQEQLDRCVAMGLEVEVVPGVSAFSAVAAIARRELTIPQVAQSVIQWSPYQNIRDDVVYPAVFQVFGELDVSCMPFHGRKFTARLDEANAGDRPIHLRVWRNVGHGTNDPVISAAYHAQWLTFLMDQLGVRAVGSRA